MSRGLRRFYVDQIFSREGDLLQLSLQETFHLHRVLRLKAGDACQIFNRVGMGAEASVQSISETEGARLLLKKVFLLKQKGISLKVAQALPQKKKMDELVGRAQELGVRQLWVMETKRTIVKMGTEAKEKARKRWERIGVEAAKQSGSPVLTQIEGPVSFEKMINEKLSREDQGFIFHPGSGGLTFAEMLNEMTQSHSAFLFFGPEGGFTDEEVQKAESKGVRKVFLGESILRLETAFVGVISALRLLTTNSIPSPF